jgi:hypothetical protein
MYRHRETPARYVPGCYGFKYIAYNIFTGTKTEHLKGFDHYPSKAVARAEFLELISKWNGQAYGSIQYWAIEG